MVGIEKGEVMKWLILLACVLIAGCNEFTPEQIHVIARTCLDQGGELVRLGQYRIACEPKAK